MGDASRYESRPGRYGTLYLYRITYKQRGDEGCPEFGFSTWAYDADHAIDKLYSDDSDWEVLKLERVRADA